MTERIYRASSLGYSMEALVAPHLGFEAVAPPEFLQNAYDEGNRLEPIVLDYLRGIGWEIGDEQLEVELDIIPDRVKVVGHLDGIGRCATTLIPQSVVEIKTMGGKSFADWVNKGWNSSSPLIEKYKWQQSAYVLATGLPHAMVGWDKDGSEGDPRTMTHLTTEPFYTISDIAAKLAKAEEFIASGLVPDGCTDFPCFSQGTLVMTEHGYRPIETLFPGDLVLTHEGNWKPITACGSREAPTRIIRSYGSTPVTTTDEHPFLTRERWYHHYKKGFPAVRKFKDPVWTDAKDLTKNTFTGQILPPVDEDNLEQVLDDNTLWLVGRYIADGWRNDSQKQVYICCSLAEESELQERIEKAGYCVFSYPDKATVRFRLPGEFYDIIYSCGKLAHGKRLPYWILALSPERAKHVLDGYLSGDGHLEPTMKKWIFSTASKELALGLGLLVQRVTNTPCSLVISKRAGTTTIEGRTVNQRTSYTCTMQYAHREGTRFRNPAAFVEDGIAWKPMNVNKPTGNVETVYNIQVADDESYMVENMIVHNCPYYYLHPPKDEVAKVEDGELEGLLQSWLVWDRAEKQAKRAKDDHRERILKLTGDSLAAKVKGECGVTVETYWQEEKEYTTKRRAGWVTRISGPRGK